ncbi:RNA polymerase sigma factor [Niabella ginsengisoli]|uniref:Sigma-70 family RNA polymerase sigma factor n=1 Tax=Niabella ginsengisoli TaxID=522298 RepID=A0ABS9SMN5_9BACT|nr:sigma-70 family RNA polymerase sigma factor [Niabella ginsengisoli]MCH5599648.1 sigma-70 family RNA polymerase sigma factor [Niabella ginsengisoli]
MGGACFFFFRKRIDNETDAEDLTQQTFIRLWQYRGSLSDNHLMETMLFQNARMVFIDWLRKEATERKRRLAAENNCERICFNPQPDYTELQIALKSLPPARQNAIRLRHLEGYSYKEIATQMNISVKTVENHVRLALIQLRKLLIPIILLFF